MTKVFVIRKMNLLYMSARVTGSVLSMAYLCGIYYISRGSEEGKR